jgi:hypothetical protein
MTLPYEELKQRQSVMWGNGPYRSNGEIVHTREYLLVTGTRT